MILETLKEWDKQRERRTKPIGELVKIELDGQEKTILAGAELIELEVARMIELLRENKAEYV